MKLIVLIVVLLTGQYYAMARARIPQVHETSAKAGTKLKKDAVTFELKNKSGGPITIDLANGGTGKSDEDNLFIDYPVPANNVIRLSSDSLNPHKYTFLRITQNGKSYGFYFPTNIDRIFVKWENNKLEAQKGRLGKSESGITLKNNVKTGNIAKARD